MATIHAYLVNKIGIMDDATDSIIYGPSTSNKIERWWRDLHERLERYFKAQAERIQAKNAIEAYRFLKQNIPCQM